MSSLIKYNKYFEDAEWHVAIRENNEIIAIKSFMDEDSADNFIKTETVKMDNKKDKNNKLRDGINDSLDKLLDDDFLNDVDSGDELPPIKPNVQHDYIQMKSSASVKAKKTITALMKFYLDEDIIEQDEYVKARKKIDEMTLSSLMFQLETAEKALVTLLQTIDSGELAPRMFEVLGTLQKSMLDIIKSQTMYLVAAEESVKKLSRDIDIFSERTAKKAGKQEESNEITNVNRGTKGLMSLIQDEIKESGYDTDTDSIEEINPDEVE